MSSTGSNAFPLLQGDEGWFWPKDGVCPTCGGSICGDFAYLSGGALRRDLSGRNSIDSRRLRAFLDIGFHTHAEDPGPAGMPLVTDLAGGQFDLYFCSTACLRRWLNRLVDDIESHSKDPDQQRQLAHDAAGWIEQGLTDGSIERCDDVPPPPDAGQPPTPPPATTRATSTTDTGSS